MAAAHNAFVQGVNAMMSHAPRIEGEKVQPFVVVCLAVVRVCPPLWSENPAKNP
jgi:hypothetical protein